MEKLYDVTIDITHHSAKLFFETEKDAIRAAAMIQKHVCPITRAENIVEFDADYTKPVSKRLEMYGFFEHEDIDPEFTEDWFREDREVLVFHEPNPFEN